MADTKITALTDGSTAELTDRFPAARDPTGTPVNRWVNVQYIITKILSLANTWLGTQTVTPAANTSAFVSSGYSLTGANTQSQVDLSGTWNTSGAPTLIKANITDTASTSAALLQDLQVGGTSKFKVRKDGQLTITGSLILSPSASINQAGAGYVLTRSAGIIGFTNETTGTTGADTYFSRDAAGEMAQRNSTNAQTFRVYNTYTDASNYERGYLRWTSNEFEIGAQAAGTGTQRATRINASVGISAGGSTTACLLLGTTAGFGIYYGSGAPTVTAGKGSLYMRTNGTGTSDRMYVNTDGATTWTAVTTAA